MLNGRGASFRQSILRSPSVGWACVLAHRMAGSLKVEIMGDAHLIGRVNAVPPHDLLALTVHRLKGMDR